MRGRIKDFVLRHFEEVLIILIFIGILAIAFLVHYKFSFLNFFFLPVILSGYFLGKNRGVLTAVFCVLLVVLYLIIFARSIFTFDETTNLVIWGCFLILTGAIIGVLSEQRENKINSLRRSYIGSLEIILKYMEVADIKRPRSLRVSILAGKIAEIAGLSKGEIENVKSAALLYEAGNLASSLPFFYEVSQFMESPGNILKLKLSDKEKVMLKTTASLLKEVEPILNGYFHHYIKEADQLDKNLDEIPVGSSIIALADIYDRIMHKIPPAQGKEEFNSIENIDNLAGRTFHASSVDALWQAVAAA